MGSMACTLWALGHVSALDSGEKRQVRGPGEPGPAGGRGPRGGSPHRSGPVLLPRHIGEPRRAHPSPRALPCTGGRHPATVFSPVGAASSPLGSPTHLSLGHTLPHAPADATVPSLLPAAAPLEHRLPVALQPVTSPPPFSLRAGLAAVETAPHAVTRGRLG